MGALASLPGWEDPLEKEIVIHSSILAWRIPMDGGSLVGCSPCGRKELDTTEQLNTHTHCMAVDNHCGFVCDNDYSERP